MSSWFCRKFGSFDIDEFCVVFGVFECADSACSYRWWSCMRPIRMYENLALYFHYSLYLLGSFPRNRYGANKGRDFKLG